MTLVSETEWQEFITIHPEAHILQTAEWGKFKAHYGWYPKYVLGEKSGAMVLFRRLPMNRTIAYVPKGPIGEDWEDLLREITQISKQERAFLIYIEPDAWEGSAASDVLQQSGYRPSSTSIQPRQTITIPLISKPETWLQRMKQKTRYNIRLAEKKGVRVERSKDIRAFNDLMAVTGERDEFGIHQGSYYEKVFSTFAPKNACELFLASYEGQPLAAIMVFAHGKRAWYFYGASNDRERNRMPTYLLQWEAMKWAASRGVSEYDLWGIPDADWEELETDFTSRSDGLWGVYRFKRGFGGEIKRTAGIFEKVLNKPLYALYQFALQSKKSLVS